VLLNLLLNAIQASPEEGRIVVELYNKTVTIKNDVKNIPLSIKRSCLLRFIPPNPKALVLGLPYQKDLRCPWIYDKG